MRDKHAERSSTTSKPPLFFGATNNVFFLIKIAVEAYGSQFRTRQLMFANRIGPTAGAALLRIPPTSSSPSPRPENTACVAANFVHARSLARPLGG